MNNTYILIVGDTTHFDTLYQYGSVGSTIYATNMHRVLLCFFVFISSVFTRFCCTLVHIHHSCFKGTESVLRMSQCEWNNLNSLRSFGRGNINIYLHFMSLLPIDETQVLKILPRVKPGPTYSTYSIPWLLMTWRRKEPGHQQPWCWPS